MNVSWIYHECILNVSWIYCECILNVSWMYPECIVDVSWMYPECITNVSWKHHKCIVKVMIRKPGKFLRYIHDTFTKLHNRSEVRWDLPCVCVSVCANGNRKYHGKKGTKGTPSMREPGKREGQKKEGIKRLMDIKKRRSFSLQLATMAGHTPCSPRSPGWSFVKK